MDCCEYDYELADFVKGGDFLSGWATSGFSGWILPYWVQEPHAKKAHGKCRFIWNNIKIDVEKIFGLDLTGYAYGTLRPKVTFEYFMFYSVTLTAAQNIYPRMWIKNLKGFGRNRPWPDPGIWHEILGQDVQCLGQDLNRIPFEYEPACQSTRFT